MTSSTAISHPDFDPALLQHLPRRTLLPNLGVPGPAPDPPHGLPDLDNVQGDVFLLFPKTVEYFVFFTIKDVQAFKNGLAKYKPTTSRDVLDHLRAIALVKRDATGDRINLVQSQLALSRSGLNKLGQTDKTLDDNFDNSSMMKDKPLPGDVKEWDTVFSDGKVDGVFMVAGEKDEDCDKSFTDLRSTFGLTDPVVLKGKLRPDQFKGHEHFGFEDGVSQPALRGLVKPNKGQLQADPGVIIMGYPGDSVHDKTDGLQRPAWTKDGTMMAFTRLEQDAIGFERYLAKNGPNWKTWLTQEQIKDINPPLNDQEGAELFGARQVGRWKSGAPLANAHYRDDPSLANQDKANDFDYSVPGHTGPSDRFCPFNIHTRKAAPRNLDPIIPQKSLEAAFIIRGGIAYGPEITQAERASYDPNAKSPRGLMFLCYQSSIQNGFILQTVNWAANDNFPPTSTNSAAPQPIVGQDPIIGSPSKNPTVQQMFPDQQFFVKSRGGEYFFVPSVATLKALASGGGHSA